MRSLVIVVFSLLNFVASSQIVKGKIVDENQFVLNEVYVLNINSDTHAHTNELGEFTLNNTNESDVLSVSKIGYKTIYFTIVNTTDKIEIVLKSDVIQLNEVILSSGINTTNAITKIDLLTNPVNSSQQILRKVPGLFIGQHAGGGKAEQIFLRGFDVDHGTDVALSMDGMPVNMVSNAHGQGYSDLHFIIPETIDNIDFGKGPYKANQGNFATAGYVNFKTKEKIEASQLSVESGMFNTTRFVGLFDLIDKDTKQNAYIATEYILTDGPFNSPQNFNRFNIFGKYSVQLNKASKLSIQASRFSSKWDASGQIPERLVASGVISRFGAVDDTEGGFTSRTNCIVTHQKAIDDDTFIKINAFYSKYDFTLFSNFTFFLIDPVNGDQIKQKENRNLYGINTEFDKKIFLENSTILFQSGMGFRVDEINGIELSRTLNRKQTLQNIQLGDVNESNLFGYFNSEIKLDKFKIAPAVRVDYFKFNYQDALMTNFKTLATTNIKVLPKLNINYSKSNKVEYFIKSGFGFHSNDTRVILQQKKEIVPTVFGLDAGSSFKPIKNLVVNTALWALYSKQEFVYVGDAGIVEPSGKSRRYGIDIGFRYQIGNYIFADFDGNYAFARSGNYFNKYIPLAPKFCSTAGLSIKNYKGFSGGINYRFLGNRAANEDNTVVAKGYFVSDFNINYKIKNLNFGIVIENIFNTQWNETQFLTESRLKNENAPVEEVHFTPGSPFFLKCRINYNF
ncbi:MAG TPA: TonB-dependent receptor [Flavobacterium sp.]|nr:TonB-dependent receptor [Flavobacterium sp.]